MDTVKVEGEGVDDTDREDSLSQQRPADEPYSIPVENADKVSRGRFHLPERELHRRLWHVYQTALAAAERIEPTRNTNTE